MLIYIVEDDKNIREIESYALKNSGYSVNDFETGDELFAACRNLVPDLIILDIMLPKEDGLTILKQLRSQEKTKAVPVIMVTAKSSEIDKVKGLDAGADDYITKPFGVMELVSRVKAILRRTNAQSGNLTLKFADLQMDTDKHIVTVSNLEVELTYKEFELLKYLLVNQGIVMSRDRIMEHVWGFDYQGESRTVDMHIKTLRQKLGLTGNIIKTIRNVGYKIGE